MKALNPTFDGLGTTIFTTMSALAVEHGAINLGQGFPDEDGPADIRQKAADALMAGPNQYPPMAGLPALRQAVAAHDQRFYGLSYNWQDEVLVTSGATEALAACLFALLSPGDEVVLFEPLYDSYLPIIRQCGAIPKIVRLEAPDWRIPPDALAAAFSPATKLVLINSPMNPTGKLFAGGELAEIAILARRHDAYLLCDEVYEHLVFDGARHQPIAALPGMRERTLRIGSAGKTFSLTGWKVGYVSGPRELISAVAKAHQFLTFTTPPDLQAAIAYALGRDDTYYQGLAAALQAKRDRLASGLAGIGFTVLPADGTYFLTVLTDGIGPALESDEAYARWLTVEAGVAAIPCSAFYAGEAPPQNMVRFCFCKQDKVLEDAISRLAAKIGGK
ncbi:aminotransferase [Hyphomonas sp. WL0036]|uniref:aminotransferase n=1 Tax=Hyphomonas sediminis TaxID=2866160 RepID=UPI001C80FC8B|nr:aminotransferase [Hyphomonas sediminis]MBY9068474.1 aminotransferase [Hyphomonas sediminis]